MTFEDYKILKITKIKPVSQKKRRGVVE